jgi:hypothetical protein
MIKYPYIFILIIFQIYACALPEKSSYNHAHPLPEKNQNKSISKVTELGNFNIDIVFNGKALKVGNNTFHIFLHKNNDYIERATITVIPWNLEYIHGSLTQPIVTDIGKGFYAVDEINLDRSGHWKFIIQIKNEGIEDRVEFVFHAHQ